MPLQKREKASPFFFFIDSINSWYYWIYQCFIFTQKGAKEERESFAVSFLLLIHCFSVAFMDFLTVQVILKTWVCLSFLFVFLLLLRVVSAFFFVILVVFCYFMGLRLQVLWISWLWISGAWSVGVTEVVDIFCGRGSALRMERRFASFVHYFSLFFLLLRSRYFVFCYDSVYSLR